jgi:hypothetical protein
MNKSITTMATIMGVMEEAAAATVAAAVKVTDRLID